MKGSHTITDKVKMLNCFTEHFIASVFFFLIHSLNDAHVNPSIVQSDGFVSSQSFNFSPIAISEMC